MADITKLYPNLPSAPAQSADMQEESQKYRLDEIGEIEKYLRSEIKERDKLAKKFKMHGTWVRYCDHGLLGISVVTSGIGIGTLLSGIGVPLAVAMGGISLAVGMAQAGLKTAGKRLGVKSKKHENIRLIAEAKLNSIVDLISRAVENGEIDKYEFSHILQEKQKYMVLKEQMRQRFNRIVDSINEQERAKLVARGRQEGREEFLKNVQSAQYASAM